MYLLCLTFNLLAFSGPAGEHAHGADLPADGGRIVSLHGCHVAELSRAYGWGMLWAKTSLEGPIWVDVRGSIRVLMVSVGRCKKVDPP